MTATTSAILEPGRNTPVFGEYEVVVLGGGPAGIAAAIAAGRAGRSTILVERYGFRGGAGTAAGLSTFCGLHANVHGDIRQVVHGIADDMALAAGVAPRAVNVPLLQRRLEAAGAFLGVADEPATAFAAAKQA